MLVLSCVNSKMLLNDCTDDGEQLQKRRRLLVINEEIYAEFSETVNGTDTLHIIPISEMKSNAKIGTEGKDTEVHELSNTEENCNDDVQAELKNKALSVEDLDHSQSSSIDDDSSDDMVIISDDEQLSEDTVTKIGNELLASVYDSYQKVAPLIGLPEDNVSIKHPNPAELPKYYHTTDSKTKDEPEIDNAQDNCKTVGKIKKRKGSRSKYQKVKMGFEHFPIKLHTKMSSLVPINDKGERTETEISKKSSSSIEPCECPYCNFKISKGRVVRHLLQQHIEGCFCSKCDSIMSCGKVESHSRSHPLCDLRCLMCTFESNNSEKFRRHLLAAHKDALFRQCSICGDWVTKTTPTCAQIQILVEHVKSKHLLQPAEKN